MSGKISERAYQDARRNVCPSGKPPALRSSLTIAHKNRKKQRPRCPGPPRI